MITNILPFYKTIHTIQYKSTNIHRPKPTSPPHQITPSKPAQPPLNTPPHNYQNNKKIKNQNNIHIIYTRSHKKQFSTS